MDVSEAKRLRMLEDENCAEEAVGRVDVRQRCAEEASGKKKW
jgi:hypothetical protein